MQFRNATLQDIDAISAIENICFPANEAASRQSFEKRIQAFPKQFWLLEVDGQLAGFVNGMVTNNKTINDEMFSNASLHDALAWWQSIFGLAVAPEFRRHGYAAKLMQHLIEQARKEGRTGLTLTCKEYLTAYYQKFGFADLGISASVHGGEVWHDMVLTL